LKDQHDLIQLQKAMLSEIINGTLQKSNQTLFETKLLDKQLAFQAEYLH
jgi:hypothetical protein